MKKSCLFALSLAVACVSFPQRSPAPVTIRPGEGATYTAPGSDEVPNQKDAQTQYDNALVKETSGDLSSALAGYRKTVRRFPKSTVAPSAQYKIGEILEKRRDIDGASTAYETLIKRYPHSTDFNRALEGEFRIGDAYLDGAKIKMLGVPLLTSRDRAIAIFSIITANAPFSRYSALAQYKIGQAFETQGDYKGAVGAYQKVVDKYPTDPVAADAQYQIAYAYMEITKSGAYDRTNVSHAREGFEDFLAEYPNHEKAAQARENLGSLATEQTGGSLEIANYYYKQAQYRGGGRLLQRRDPPAAELGGQHEGAVPARRHPAQVRGQIFRECHPKRGRERTQTRRAQAWRWSSPSPDGHRQAARLCWPPCQCAHPSASSSQ